MRARPRGWRAACCRPPSAPETREAHIPIVTSPRPLPSDASFAGVDASVAAELLTVGGDFALTLDARGSIVDVRMNAADGEGLDTSNWIGRSLSQIVTSETRGKAEALVAEGSMRGIARRRQVNHPQRGAPDFPVQYSAIKVRDQRLVVIGRDLRSQSALQQRLVAAQETMERDYWRLRHAETRYRHIFQMANEAILVLDADSYRILDANRAALALFALESDALVGQAFPVAVRDEDVDTMRAMLAQARSTGRSDDERGEMAVTGRAFTASATCFRQEQGTVMLLRLVSDQDGEQPPLLELLERAPDAFVVTDLLGRILTANAAFLGLADLQTAQEVVGMSLGRWLGHADADVPQYLERLREQGMVRLARTSLRSHHGALSEVEVSAVWAEDGDLPCVGWVIRDIGRRPVLGPESVRDLARAVEHLTQLVGQVSLRELVRDTIDLVERHFIGAALELTRNNRTSAAEVLGVSRQSLYVKLRRYRFQNLDETDAGERDP